MRKFIILFIGFLIISQMSFCLAQSNLSQEEVKGALVDEAGQKLSNLSDEKKEEIIKAYESFRGFSEEDKNRVINNYHEFEQASEEDKSSIKKNFDKFQAFPDAKKAEIADSWNEFKELPQEKQELWENLFKKEMSVSEKEQNANLNDNADHFKDAEEYIIDEDFPEREDHLDSIDRATTSEMTPDPGAGPGH